MNVLRIWFAMVGAALISACGSADSTGAGGGGSSSTTTGAGGALGEDCNTCVEVKAGLETTGTPCNSAAQACQADAACGAWMECTNTCFQEHRPTDCFAACDAAGSSAKSLYDPLYACVCAACASECSPICM